MRRREFTTLLGGLAFAWPLAAQRTAAGADARIGVLMGWPESDSEAQAQIAAFRDELQKLGWMEGRNILIETRWATPTDAAAMQRFAKELAGSSPTSFLRAPHPLRPRCCNKRALSPSFSRPSAIRSAAALCTSSVSAGRQRHRFLHYRGLARRQVAGATQGDSATRRPGRAVVQPGNSKICRTLPELLQNRRCFSRGGGDRRTCS